MRDSGDECDAELDGSCCPFCGDKMRKPHATPIANLDKLSRDDMEFLVDAIRPGIEMVSLEPSFKFEVMWTCYECRTQAQRFAREQRRTRHEKQHRAHLRDAERKDGMIGLLLPVEGRP
jgi:hypothetical protein